MLLPDVKKIVVGFDGSAGSKRALYVAFGIAQKFGAEVIALTVVKPPEYTTTVDEIDEAVEEAKRFYQPAFAENEALARRYDIPFRSVLLHGHPAATIVTFATEQKADLIVTGTRGMGGFKSMIIGSVAQKVVSYSRVPVLIVKEG